MENTEILREEPIFKASHILNESDNEEFQKFAAVKYRMRTLIFFIAFEVILIYLGISAKLNESLTWWVFILAAVIILIQTVIPTNRNKSSNNSKMGCESRYLFYKDFFVNVFNNNETEVNFINCEAYETKRKFYIVMNKKEGFVIDKDDLETGTAEAFTEYLKEKLGEKFTACKK